MPRGDPQKGSAWQPSALAATQTEPFPRPPAKRRGLQGNQDQRNQVSGCRPRLLSAERRLAPFQQPLGGATSGRTDELTHQLAGGRLDESLQGEVGHLVGCQDRQVPLYVGLVERAQGLCVRHLQDLVQHAAASGVLQEHQEGAEEQTPPPSEKGGGQHLQVNNSSGFPQPLQHQDPSKGNQATLPQPMRGSAAVSSLPLPGGRAARAQVANHGTAQLQAGFRQPPVQDLQCHLEAEAEELVGNEI